MEAPRLVSCSCSQCRRRPRGACLATSSSTSRSLSRDALDELAAVARRSTSPSARSAASSLPCKWGSIWISTAAAAAATAGRAESGRSSSSLLSSACTVTRCTLAGASSSSSSLPILLPSRLRLRCMACQCCCTPSALRPVSSRSATAAQFFGPYSATTSRSICSSLSDHNRLAVTWRDRLPAGACSSVPPLRTAGPASLALLLALGGHLQWLPVLLPLERSCVHISPSESYWIWWWSFPSRRLTNSTLPSYHVFILSQYTSIFWSSRSYAHCFFEAGSLESVVHSGQNHSSDETTKSAESADKAGKQPMCQASSHASHSSNALPPPSSASPHFSQNTSCASSSSASSSSAGATAAVLL